MRHFLIAAVVAIAAGSAAYAQDMPKADPDAAAPTKRMDEAAPTMKATEGAQQQAPKKQVGDAVPSMKSTDPQSADTATKTGVVLAEEQWVGRYVYSSDGKDLGKVASVNKNGNLNQVGFDMGGFLGLGATRKSVASDQIQEVQYDRIVLRLTEAEAKNLPADKTAQ
jgi:opacity protein-like surface antigen